MSNTPATDADETALTDQTQAPSSRLEAYEEDALSEQQAQQRDEGMPSQGSAFHANYAATSVAFVTSSSVLHSTPNTAMTDAGLPDEAPEEADVDPLSHRFEEHMLTTRQEASHVMLQEMVESHPPHAQQPRPWGGARGFATLEQRSRAASPSLSDHDSFDPLTATFEEFEAFNRSREKRIDPPSEQLPAQLPEQSPAVSNLQLPQQQQPPAAGTSTHPRKTRSIPRIFRLRKTGSTAEASSTSNEAAAAATDLHPTEADTEVMLPSTGEVDPNQAAGPLRGPNADPPPAASKPRSKPFSLLRKRSKGTAKPVPAQQPLPVAPVPLDTVYTSAPLPEAGIGGSQTPISQLGLLQDRGAGEQQHLNTVLALSAGLPGTFGSFMAASPRGSPSSPRQQPQGSHDDSEEPLSDQVSSASVQRINAPCRALLAYICCYLAWPAFTTQTQSTFFISSFVHVLKLSHLLCPVLAGTKHRGVE